MPRYNWKNVQNYSDHPHSKEDTQKAFKMHKGTWYDAVKRKAIILREEDYVSNSKYDNTLKNLRILYPNCHSQTSTYCGRNAKYE